MGALLTVAQTASAEPPPKPAFKVINRTPFEIEGIFTIYYELDGSNTYENLVTGGSWDDRTKATIPAHQEQGRVLRTRFNAHSLKVRFECNAICIKGKPCTTRHELLGRSDEHQAAAKPGNYAPQYIFFEGGRLKASFTVELTGWTSQDYAHVYLDWEQ